MRIVDDPSQPYIVLACDSKEEWRQARRKYITASDVPVLCSDAPWVSVPRLEAEKLTGSSDYDERPKWGKQPMYWGKKTEEQLLEFWRDMEGGTLMPWNQDHLLVSREYPWLAATPDAFWLADGDGEPAILEAKCTRSLTMFERAILPDYHAWQVQGQLTCTRFKHAWLVAKIQGDETVKIGPILSDPLREKVLLEKTKRFHEQVIVGGGKYQPPPVVVSEGIGF